MPNIALPNSLCLNSTLSSNNDCWSCNGQTSPTWLWNPR